MSAAIRAVAVLDVGKTNVKLLLHEAETNRESVVRAAPNRVLRDGLYPHYDTDAIAALLLDGLAELARHPDLHPDTLVVTTHGASAALLGRHGLALPVLDYEHDGPDRFRRDYDALRPPFSESFSPRLPGGLNVGAQLFWQARTFPEAFARVEHIVTYPQYWAWWLTGVAVNEPTSLGAHTDLWAPRAGHYSSLVKALGLETRMAPLRSAFDVLGPLKPDLAQRLGFREPLPVLCGIHDSNASLLPHLQASGPPLSVVSTGTWAIVFAIGGSLDRLDPRRDTLANVDAFGRATPSARFMGGREFDLLVDGRAVTPEPATVASVLDRRIMAWPGFSPGNGPFPTARGRWSHDAATLSPAERTAAASLYVALMTATCLDLLAARGPTIVEGPFAANALFLSALQVLTGRLVSRSNGGSGTSAGAARLALPKARPPATVPAEQVTALAERLQAYAAEWRIGCASPACFDTALRAGSS